MNRYRRPHEDYEEMKRRLQNAFKRLRKLGYVARSNFWCCSSCAWSDLTEAQASHAVFYNKQAGENFKNNGQVHLQWSGDGKLITSVLREEGLTLDWDGTLQNSITVTGAHMYVH